MNSIRRQEYTILGRKFTYHDKDTADDAINVYWYSGPSHLELDLELNLDLDEWQATLRDESVCIALISGAWEPTSAKAVASLRSRIKRFKPFFGEL